LTTDKTHHKGHDFAGHVNVSVGVRAGRVVGVDIDSPHPQGVAQVFAGRKPCEVVALLGMMFSVCGTAQTVAGLHAVEQARGLRIADAEAAARNILREVELLGHTALRVFRDWPRLLGLAPEDHVVDTVLSSQGSLQSKLFGGRNWKAPGGVGLSPDVGGVCVTLRDLSQTLQSGDLIERMLDRLDELGLNDFGALVEGAAPELGALSRHWDSAAVSQVRQRHGAGLRARLVARLEDLASIPVSLMEAAEHLTTCAPAAPVRKRHGEGVATVETARGPLMHRVAIKNEHVHDYEIAATMDAHFAQDSELTKGLIAADSGDVEALKRAVQLHMLAIDPCVQCELVVQDA